MQIRIMGLPGEVAVAVSVLMDQLNVVSVSEQYPCRGPSRQVRVYVETRPADQRPAPRSGQ